ncbi:MAG: DUF11 domain-containing protein [Parcubacteria group bacterium]|nr:DUF11 domain-containing protein [Parcubacteria group bacterium]
MSNNSEGRIERLKKILYRRDKNTLQKKRFELHSHGEEQSDSWNEEPALSETAQVRTVPNPPMPFWKKFFLFSVLFFTLALVIAAFVFLRDSNIVSTRNVDILVSGPVAVPAGEEVQLQVIIENNNSVSLESADLLIEYPEGTRGADNLERELTRFRKAIPNIKPGEVVKEPIRVVLFGQEGDEKKFKITLEYRVADSNAIFAKEKEYIAHVSSSATSLSVETLAEVVSGQEFKVDITITSNTDTVTRDLLLSVEYPFGFSFISAEPRPVSDNTVWTVGDLAPGGKRTITIRGVMEGQDGEEKVFRVSLGGRSGIGENRLGVVYNSSLAAVKIARPFVSVLLFVNGDATAEYVAGSRELLDVSIVWTNNLPTKIVDAKLEAKLNGAVIDKSSVDPRNGFYNSANDTILWDKNSLPELAEIESGAQGRTSFRFTPQPLFTQNGTLFRNPEVSIVITTSGKRLSERGVQESIEGRVEQKIKISSEAVFSANAVYFIGPFQNIGPLPPEVEKETTYTIVWTAVNSSNHISRGTVRTVLPPYVAWRGVKAPGGEDVTYNEASREITWNLGRLEAGAGVTLPPRTAAFQIGFIPSISQLNQSPTISGESVFSGVDEFTGAAIRLTGKALTISLNSDPNFVFTQGKVVESPAAQ